MKRLSLKPVCLSWLLLSAACHAYESVPLSRDTPVSSSILKKTGLDNADLFLDINGKQYHAGFTIDAAGINTPTLVEVDQHGVKQNSWTFDDIIADIFIFDSHVSIALYHGESYSFIDNAWQRNALQMAGRSRIVFSDGKQRLIACSPASLYKEGSRTGGCESYNPNWKISFAWHEVKPKVCGDLLYAVTWSRKQNQRMAIDLDSGKVVHQKVFAGEDVCAPFGP